MSWVNEKLILIVSDDFFFSLLMIFLYKLHQSAITCLFFYSNSTAQDDKDFLHRSILPTDHFQASLPRLPVPELEDTLKKYLESQRQILTDAEYDQTVDFVNKFKATDGPGTIIC